MIRRRRKPPQPSWMPPPISRLAWDALTARVEKISDIVAAGYEASNVPVPGWLKSAATEPDYSPPAGHPEAESLPLGAADDVMLAGWSLDLWPQDEYQRITADGEQ